MLVAFYPEYNSMYLDFSELKNTNNKHEKYEIYILLKIMFY